MVHTESSFFQTWGGSIAESRAPEDPVDCIVSLDEITDGFPSGARICLLIPLDEITDPLLSRNEAFPMHLVEVTDSMAIFPTLLHGITDPLLSTNAVPLKALLDAAATGGCLISNLVLSIFLPSTISALF
jgi:hypothetical protein